MSKSEAVKRKIKMSANQKLEKNGDQILKNNETNKAVDWRESTVIAYTKSVISLLESSEMALESRVVK